MARLTWDTSVCASGHSLVIRIPADLARMGGIGRGALCRVTLAVLEDAGDLQAVATAADILARRDAS